MKLSVSRLLLLLASCSFFNKLKDCDAASSSLELTDEEGNEDVGGLLRGANSNNNNNMIFVVNEEETKKEVFAGEAADHVIATDVVTMIKDEEGFDNDQFHRELEEGRRHRWSTYCSTGRTHEEKCGGSRPDCCNEKVKDANENISFLTCRKKNEDSDNNRCHEIHSDAINWPMLCSFKGKLQGGKCDLPSAYWPLHGNCCSEVADFDEYKIGLECLKVPEQDYGICTEVHSGSRKWSEVCSSGRIAGQSCEGGGGGGGTSSSTCCSHVYHLGDRTVSLVCDKNHKKCLETQSFPRHSEWSKRCDSSGGGASWGEKCGGDDSDCCTAQSMELETLNMSILKCRSETSGNNDERCQEIHSDAIDWPMLCNKSGGKTEDEECTDDQDCCQELADFDEHDHRRLICKTGRCQEVKTTFRWDKICSGPGAYDLCGGSYGDCCSDEFQYGIGVLRLVCETSSGKCMEAQFSSR